MLDSPEGVCPGQAPFEYPATSVRFSNYSTAARLTWLSSWRVSLPTRRIPCHLAREPRYPAGSFPSPLP